VSHRNRIKKTKKPYINKTAWIIFNMKAVDLKCVLGKEIIKIVSSFPFGGNYQSFQPI